MSDAVTIPVVISTIVIVACKLGLFLLDRYYPAVGSEITTLVDQITNLHAKVDQIIPTLPKPSGPISIKVVPL